MHFITNLAKYYKNFGKNKAYSKNLLNKIIKSKYITLKNKKEIKTKLAKFNLFDK